MLVRFADTLGLAARATYRDKLHRLNLEAAEVRALVRCRKTTHVNVEASSMRAAHCPHVGVEL